MSLLLVCDRKDSTRSLKIKTPAQMAGVQANYIEVAGLAEDALEDRVDVFGVVGHVELFVDPIYTKGRDDFFVS